MGAATNPIKVSISQFYGIEINDFQCTYGVDKSCLRKTEK